MVLPQLNAPVVATWQDHHTQSHDQLTPGSPAIVPSTHLIMLGVSKGLLVPYFNDVSYVAAGD